MIKDATMDINESKRQTEYRQNKTPNKPQVKQWTRACLEKPC